MGVRVAWSTQLWALCLANPAWIAGLLRFGIEFLETSAIRFEKGARAGFSIATDFARLLVM